MTTFHSDLADDERELFEERAAIHQYDGEKTRRESEAMAMKEVMRRRELQKELRNETDRTKSA